MTNISLRRQSLAISAGYKPLEKAREVDALGKLPGVSFLYDFAEPFGDCEERTGLLVLELRNEGPETTSSVSLKYFLRDLTGQSTIGPAEFGCTSLGGRGSSPLSLILEKEPWAEGESEYCICPDGPNAVSVHCRKLGNSVSCGQGEKEGGFLGQQELAWLLTEFFCLKQNQDIVQIPLGDPDGSRRPVQEKVLS